MQLIQKLLNNIFFLLCVTLLISCSKLANIGKKEDVYGNVKDRVAILKTDSSVFIDYTLETSEINLPKREFNDKWYSSNNYDKNTVENLKLATDLNNKKIEKIGKSSSKDQYLISTPIAAKDKIFVSDSEGVISAYDINNIKKRIWQYKINFEQDDLTYSNPGLLYNNNNIYSVADTTRV